jgi:hypothetical protein
VCVKTDCENLIHAINREGEDRSRWASVIKEIQTMRSLLPDCSFNHTKQQANEVVGMAIWVRVSDTRRVPDLMGMGTRMIFCLRVAYVLDPN